MKKYRFLLQQLFCCNSKNINRTYRNLKYYYILLPIQTIISDTKYNLLNTKIHFKLFIGILYTEYL